MPRNETWERSGSFKEASPPAVSGEAWARAAVPFDKTTAVHTAPATANRLRSERTLASQVHISRPPSKIINQGNCQFSILEVSKLPTRHSPAKAARRAGSQPAPAGRRLEPAPALNSGTPFRPGGDSSGRFMNG